MTFLGRTVVGLALAAVVSACTGGSGSSTPSPTPAPGSTPAASASPAPTASLSGAVTSAAQAAALVFASDPHFGAIRPQNNDLIGQCCGYDASEAGSRNAGPAYQVTINVGWGDCESGCISHHTWQFHVDADGTITLQNQQGDADPPIPAGQGATAQVTLHLRAGPTCPVEQNPPQSGCAPRPVINASVVLRDPSGKELATATSDDKGEIQLLVAVGAYYVEPQQAQGLMGSAAAVAFSVVGGETVDVNLDYDTGIR